MNIHNKERLNFFGKDRVDNMFVVMYRERLEILCDIIRIYGEPHKKKTSI